MCWACEEQDLMYRYELEMAVARDVMPEGFTAADFEAAGLPVPGTSPGVVQADQESPSPRTPSSATLRTTND